MCLNPFETPDVPQVQLVQRAAETDGSAALAAARERRRRLKARGAAATILSDPLAPAADLPVATKTLLGQ
jgi:hypothetical protein